MSIHIELRSTDPQATAKFLEEFFNWKIQTWKTDAGEFLVFTDGVEGSAVGGDIELAETLPADPTSVVYFEVPALREGIRKAEELRATIYRPFTLVGGDVRIAIVAAPGGCHLGLWSKVD